jgi:hypothetical protein
LFLGASATFALGSFVLWGTILPTVGTIILVGIGLVSCFICMIGWGLEPI